MQLVEVEANTSLVQNYLLAVLPLVATYDMNYDYQRKYVVKLVEMAWNEMLPLHMCEKRNRQLNQIDYLLTLSSLLLSFADYETLWWNYY